MDAIDKMKTAFSKDQKEICRLAIEKFTKDGFSNEYTRSLKSNLDKVINNDNLEEALQRVPTDDDIVNYWAYYFYTDCKMTINDFARISLIKEDKDTEVSINGYNFKWNTVKAELSFIKHNLRFDEAVLYYYDSNNRRFKRKDSDRVVTFTFNINGTFIIVTVDLEPGRVIRIISFRESSKEEYIKYERGTDYERLA